MLEQIRQFANSLGRRRLMIMGGVAALLIAVLATVALRGSDSQMGFLYTDLDPATAQAISEKLKSQNIPFQLSTDGTSILAPQDRLAEFRMAMAGEKLGGKIGYDVLDEEQPFGVSASRARLNETRAIEGELARSIETLDPVSRARVHLVMPDRGPFATQESKASAAVTLRTRGRLSGEAIESIRYLVSSAVPELSPDEVSIVDQAGRLLARAGSPAGGGDGDERQAEVESRLRQEIEALVEPIVGEGKVRARVAVRLDRDQTREESNRFDPEGQVISRQVTVDRGEGADESSPAEPASSVGAQLPENRIGAPVATGPSRKSNRKEVSEDTTYDNSAVRKVVVRTPGAITRVTAAVMVDAGTKGLSQNQIQRLTRLVENAVGFDQERGDSVVVEAMPFTGEEGLAAEDSGLLSMVTSDQIFGVLKLLVIGIIGLIAIRMLRPRNGMDGAAGATPSIMGELLPNLGSAGDAQRAALEADAGAKGMPMIDQEVALSQVEGRIKLSTLNRIGEAVEENPTESAAVIRQWLAA